MLKGKQKRQLRALYKQSSKEKYRKIELVK